MDEVAALEIETEAEPLDSMTVQDWLNRTKPAAILALLKEPEYGFAVSRIFLGFRADAKGYANPLVRTRLAQAAIKDAKLADKLRELAETEPKSTAPKPSSAPTLPAPAKPDPVERMRSERDQRRRERDEARQGVAEAEAERDTARRAQQSAEVERDEAARLAKKQAERIARLERQVAQLRETEARLVRALNEDKVSPRPSSPARSAAPPLRISGDGVSPWLTAVHHLLDKNKFDQALALAEDVLKSNTEDSDALEIAVRALAGKKDPRSAVTYAHRLLTVQIQHHEMASAAETLLRLLKQVPHPEEANAEARQYLAALAPSDTHGIEAGRLLLSRLRGTDPAAHDWLTSLIATSTPLAPFLMPLPGALGPDDPIPSRVGLDQTATAQQIVQAIDRGAPLVDTVRPALLVLESADSETHARIWAALEQAASDDPQRLTVLRRTSRGPIVVDGSNVAWFDQESLVHGKPRLRHLRAMRRALWARGFFPVVLYADANLPYFIDEPAALRAMRDRRELNLVDAGTVADEVLLRTAKHLSAPLVTNDKMDDWDPEREVPKIRFTISMSGEAHLLTDL